MALRWRTLADSHAAGPAVPLDAALVARLARGDEVALDELIATHGARVRTYLGYVVRDGAWADDLTQEVFLRVHENAAAYDATWPVLVWLLRIARNLAIDLWRREAARARALDPRRFAGARAVSTAHVVEQREFHERLQLALAELPEVFRSVFVLREVDQLSYEAIAAITDTSVRTVSTRLHRARAKLRRLLAPYLER